MDKSSLEPNEILITFALDEHKHRAIYAEAFHFLRDFIVINIVRQKSLPEQGYPFSLKPARVLRQPLKLFFTIIEWDSPENRRMEEGRASPYESQKQTAAPRQMSHYITSNFHPFLLSRYVGRA